MFELSSEIIFLSLFLVVAFSFLLSSPFDISCKAGFMVLNSFSFCLSIKLLISPSNLNDSLVGQSILSCRFFPFSTLSISCHSLLACKVSAEKSGDSLMEILLYVTSCSSLAAFKILSLPSIFAVLIVMCLGADFFGLIFFGFILFVLPGPGYQFPSPG